MPNIDSSVALCNHCDTYVAADLIAHCEECFTALACVRCGFRAKSEPSLIFCSQFCAAKFDRDQKTQKPIDLIDLRNLDGVNRLLAEAGIEL